MKSEDKARSFFFHGHPVGYFEEDPPPSSPGRHRYMPYRGLGHYQLQVSLKTSGPQRCYYEIGDKKIHFTVLSCPSYGLLELAEFDALPPGPTATG